MAPPPGMWGDLGGARDRGLHCLLGDTGFPTDLGSWLWIDSGSEKHFLPEDRLQCPEPGLRHTGGGGLVLVV